MSIFRIHGAFDEAGAASVSLIDLNNINHFLNPLEYTLNGSVPFVTFRIV